MFSSVSQTRIEPIGNPRSTLSSSALRSGCFHTKARWNLGTRILPAATRSTSLPRKTTSGTTSVRF